MGFPQPTQFARSWRAGRLPPSANLRRAGSQPRGQLLLRIKGLKRLNLSSAKMEINRGFCGRRGRRPSDYGVLRRPRPPNSKSPTARSAHHVRRTPYRGEKTHSLRGHGQIAASCFYRFYLRRRADTAAACISKTMRVRI